MYPDFIRRGMAKRFNRIFLFVGIILLILLFRFFGIGKTLGYIQEMGWKFGVILLVCFVNNIFLTGAWMAVINKPLRWFHYFSLLLARIAGDATSSINTLGSLAGEPIKALYVRDIIPFRTGLASVVLDRTIHTVASILVILTGVCVSFFVLNLPSVVTIASLVLVLAALFGMVILLKKQRQGLVNFFLKYLPGIIRERFMRGDRAEKIKKLDDEIAEIFSTRQKRTMFYLSLVIHYLSTLATQALEIYCIVVFVQPGVGFHVVDAVFVYIFGFVLTSAMFFMPANVGTSEGSYSLALGLLGYDPALGFSVGIIRRLRSFAWSALGVLLLLHAGLLKSSSRQE